MAKEEVMKGMGTVSSGLVAFLLASALPAVAVAGEESPEEMGARMERAAERRREAKRRAAEMRRRALERRVRPLVGLAAPAWTQAVARIREMFARFARSVPPRLRPELNRLVSAVVREFQNAVARSPGVAPRPPFVRPPLPGAGATRQRELTGLVEVGPRDVRIVQAAGTRSQVDYSVTGNAADLRRLRAMRGKTVTVLGLVTGGPPRGYSGRIVLRSIKSPGGAEPKPASGEKPTRSEEISGVVEVVPRGVMIVVDPDSRSRVSYEVTGPSAVQRELRRMNGKPVTITGLVTGGLPDSDSGRVVVRAILGGAEKCKAGEEFVGGQCAPPAQPSHDDK